MSFPLWKELSRLALLGADRSRLSVSAREELAELGLDPDQPDTTLLLEGAAVVSRRATAGKVPDRSEADQAPPPEEEDKCLCSSRSSTHLELILDGPFGNALPEFVALMKENLRTLPPESLPALLDRCREDPELWENLAPGLGTLGAWLIKQNPRWQAWAAVADPRSWDAAPQAERQLILSGLREREPKKAIAILEEEWPRLKWREKIAFLETLQQGHSPADEAFLETCLDDGRKEVRLAAAALLAKRPGSALVRRAIQLGTALVRPAPGGKWQVQLPEADDDALQRDGIAALATVGKGSLRQGLLKEIVRRIPPRTWEDHLDMDPAECLGAFGKTDQAKPLLDGLTEAICQFEATEWMKPLFYFWSLNPDRLLWKNATAQKLMAKFPNDLFDALCEEVMERDGLMVEEETPLGQLLLLGEHPWSDTLTLRLVGGFQSWLKEAGKFYWNTWHYKRLFEIAAYRSNPELFDKLNAGWPQQSRLWPSWEKDAEGLMRTLFFRRDMRKELMAG